jgi:hypothetical protein
MSTARSIRSAASSFCKPPYERGSGQEVTAKADGRSECVSGEDVLGVVRAEAVRWPQWVSRLTKATYRGALRVLRGANGLYLSSSGERVEDSRCGQVDGRGYRVAGVGDGRLGLG